jgi:hypothetical protein
MNTHQRIVILSAELSDKTFESNKQRTENLAACLDDCNMRFTRGTGCCKGSEETCFIVFPKDNHEVDTIKDFAFKSFNQESILEQDANGYAWLEYGNGKVENIGKLRQVTSYLELRELDSYAVVNGKVYTTQEL